MTDWSFNDLPNLSDKTALISGANGGLGFVSSHELARAGATVVMTCRNVDKGQAALASIREQLPDAKLELLPLDLADQSSIQQACATFQGKHGKLDILLNNAGIINMPKRQTVDGFESMVGTNFLGHFSLTGHLLESLNAAPAARVVSVGSAGWMHRFARIRLHDLNWEKGRYHPLFATGQAKLALQIFAFELNRRLNAANSSTQSIAVHPGVAYTNVSFAAFEHARAPVKVKISRWLHDCFVQSADDGALPQLYAATADGVKGGDCYGPKGFLELGGAPKPVKSAANAYDEDTGHKLWALAEELTGVRYLS